MSEQRNNDDAIKMEVNFQENEWLTDNGENVFPQKLYVWEEILNSTNNMPNIRSSEDNTDLRASSSPYLRDDFSNIFVQIPPPTPLPCQHRRCQWRQSFETTEDIIVHNFITPHT